MVRVYRKKNFNIYSGDDDTYIIHNTNKKFSEGHTHIREFKTCKYVIDLAIHKSIPHHLNNRLLVSLVRITDDENYKERINKILNGKIKQPYVNIKKKRR